MMENNFDFKSEIVISGLSGRFPQSDSLDEFWQNLIDGKDMITEHSRYNNLGHDMPSRMGVLKTLEKFDADFFTIHAKQTNVLDPRLRKLLEVTHEAIVDAGINPAKLQGTNTGVFVAASDSEAAAIWKRSGCKTNVYGVLGNAYSMLANRLSFTFGLNGPSYVLDTACSSSSVAIQQALLSIRLGLCDSAIVAGAHLHHDAIASYMFSALEMTSRDCKCKSFDAAADGYARAEAAVAIYICKKDQAKRSYATLVHATTNNDGYKEQGITFPSEVQQEKVIRRVYDETGVSPLEVDYIEAHGTGTKVGDPEELLAVSKVFCEGRKKPLLVGSVKSNMGHPEPVAGLCSIAKVILSHTHGIIPANLHYYNPNPDIPALHDGRIEVVGKTQPFQAKYVGVNSMGFGGTNVHILLKLENETQQHQTWSPGKPLIMLASGRTEEAVKYFLENSLENQQNRDFVKLVHELSNENIARHPFRGYVVTGSEKTEIHVDKNDVERSVWFIFTGLGSQWVGMSKDLIKFAAFKNSITKSAEILCNNNFDLLTLLESGDSSLFDDFRNAVISITTIQIALVDLLRSVGIEHDGIVGHSTGEVASGYADGCLTQQQALLVSFARVRAVLESGCPPGIVASVGLTWEEAKRRCPEGVYPAIHNAQQNVTIAGSPEAVTAFVKELESEGVFAKLVRSAAFGFHSPLVEKSGPVAQKLLELVIPDPKPRSKKWLSSSVPENLWDSDLAKYCSAAYYVNNGVSPVYFYPTLLHLPGNIVALEIAPHCFMQTILKQSLAKDAVKVGLIHVKSPDNCQYFLNAMGTCYNSGLKVDVGALYDQVQFPVSSRTPNISSMIKWDYSENWYVPHNSDEMSKQKGTRMSVGLQNEAESFIEGHSLDGKIVFPATGYLWLVWKIFSEQQAKTIDTCPIVFENVRFERITMMGKRDESTFYVNILFSSGQFEVIESDMIVCSGVIRNIEGLSSEEMFNYENYNDIDTTGSFMVKDDFYKEMHLRGYGHSGQFQGIKEIDMEGRWAKVEWPGHWASFLDAIIQIYVLKNKTRDLFVPIRLEKATIDPVEVKQHLSENENLVTVKAWEVYGTGTCPGIELRGLGFAKFSQKFLEMKPTTTEQAFFQYLPTTSSFVTEDKAIESSVEIAIDNTSGAKFIFTEVLSNDPENMISHLVFSQCMLAFPAFESRTVNECNATLSEDKLMQGRSRVLSLDELKTLEHSNFVFVDKECRVAEAELMLLPGGFVLFKGATPPQTQMALISEKRFLNASKESVSFYLLRKLPAKSTKMSVISADSSNFEWVETAKEAVKNLGAVDRLIFTSTSSKSGIVGFVKSLVREATPAKIRCYHTIQPLQLNFQNPSKVLQGQLQKDLLYNVYKNNAWGYFSNTLIPLEEFQRKKLSSHVYANALKMGELSSLSWIETPLKHSRKDLVEVSFASLNFRDIMLATGRLSQDALPGSAGQEDCVLGLEFSGKLKGKRVFGMGISQCLATHIDPSRLVMFDMPNHWSYEDAATVPAVYVTVYLALIVRGKMRPGETVLIHAGSGGVGQAAIAVALSMNCKVFTTVSTQEKRDFLKARFPGLKDDAFANSRDARDFLQHIKKQTNGRGVNLVLNCLAQDKLKASIQCLSKNGRFLEIGKFDLFNDTNIGLSVLLKGASIHGILADQLIEDGPSEDMEALKKHMHDGIASGVIRPLNATVFKHSQLEEAFRFMAQGKHIGKVLVQMKEEESVPAIIPAYPRTYFQGNKSYVIIGGLGGMGFELAHWMISRGARNFVLTSRTGVKSTYHEYQIELWEKRGVTVVISRFDASKVEGARLLLEMAKKLGPIGGIFNTAVVLKDALFENQTPETFEESAKCKADTTIHLDVLSREFAPELDHFVVFSSIVSARGNAGQTNYGFANSVMERICEQRKADGLPALAVQWGAVGDVGVVHRQMKDKQTFSGLVPQKLNSCLETLDLYLQQDKPVVSSFLFVTGGDVASTNSTDSLVEIAAHILGIKDVSKVNHKTTLVDLGMDSLMAAELGQVLASRKNIQISAKSFPQLTFEKLAELDQNDSAVNESEAQDSLPKFQKLLKLRKLAETPVFKMKSLSKTDDVVFMVHPMDGTMQTLETLVENLDFHIYGMECVKEAPLESIEALAAFYLERIKKIQPHGPYKLVGYSFGGSVAFEMALQLEKQKEQVSTLLLLDGSPKWKDAIANFGGEDARRQDVENSVLFNLLQQYTSDIDLTVFKQLSEIQSLEDKWKFMAKFLSSAFPEFSAEELNDFMMSYMKRMGCAKVYEVSGKVKAKTVLVKALQMRLDKTLALDYGLSGICEEEVEVIGVEGNHYCFYEKPLELDLPSIVNNILRN